MEQVIFNIVSCNNSHIQKQLREVVKAKINKDDKNISQSIILQKLKKMKITQKILLLIPGQRNTHAIYASELFMIPGENIVF